MLCRCLLLAVTVCVLVCPLAAKARTDQPLAIRAAVSEATVQGSVVQGTIWLTVVNGGNQNISGLKLKLIQPASGLLGAGTVEIGDVAQGETVIVSTAFRLEKASFDSPEPLVVETTFSEADGTETKPTLTVERNGGAR